MLIFSQSPLISESSDFPLSWSQVSVGARYYWRGEWGVGGYMEEMWCCI